MPKVLAALFLILGIVGLVLHYRTRTLVNWSGNASGDFKTVYSPENEQELISVMKKLPPKTPMIISGVSHSWTPSLFVVGTNTTNSAEINVSLKKLKGNIAYDAASKGVSCLAGTPIGELLYFLAKRKRTLATYPNSPFITVGGMVATCSHGAALGAGSVSDLVTDLTYILPGQAECARVPPHLLGAYASSLGRLGVVCTISLRTIPISWLKQTTSHLPRASCVQEISTIVNRSDLLKIFWNPASDMCEIQEFVRLPDTENDAISLYPCKIENHFRVYQAQDLSEGINYAPELDTQFGVSKVPLSLKNTSGFGHCQKQFECPQSIPLMMDAEFCLPMEYLDEALSAIKAWIEPYKAKLSSDSIYLRFTGGDSLPWLSPVKGDGVYAWIIVSLDYTKMPDPSAAFRVLENELWRKSKARPHLGKWNNVQGEKFIEMYGEDGAHFLDLANRLQ